MRKIIPGNRLYKVYHGFPDSRMFMVVAANQASARKTAIAWLKRQPDSLWNLKKDSYIAVKWDIYRNQGITTLPLGTVIVPKP